MERPTKGLPTGLKVIGWVGVVGGAWNLIALPIALATEPGLLAQEAARGPRTFFWWFIPLFPVWLVSSIGLLKRRDWGRKGTILIFCVMFVAVVVVLVSTGIFWLQGDAPVLFVVFSILLSLACAGVPLFLLVRYLMSERVRWAFSTSTEPMPPPKQTTRRGLPTGVKVIGWIIAIVTGWNLIFLPIFLAVVPSEELEKDAPHLLRPEAWFLIGVAVLMMVWMFISTVGLLRRREWGRRGTIASCCVYVAAAAAGAVWAGAVTPEEQFSGFQHVLAPLVGIALGALLLVWMVRYLMREDVREVFSKPPGPADH